jgi:hypothetical protein
MLSRARAEGNLQAANYFIAQKYLDALAAFAASPNQKTLILPIEATAALGSLGSVAELAREALGARPPPAAGPRTHGGAQPWGGADP